MGESDVGRVCAREVVGLLVACAWGGIGIKGERCASVWSMGGGVGRLTLSYWRVVRAWVVALLAEGVAAGDWRVEPLVGWDPEDDPFRWYEVCGGGGGWCSM